MFKFQACTISRFICHDEHPRRRRQQDPQFIPFMYCVTSSASVTRVLVVADETAICMCEMFNWRMLLRILSPDIITTQIFILRLNYDIYPCLVSSMWRLSKEGMRFKLFPPEKMFTFFCNVHAMSTIPSSKKVRSFVHGISCNSLTTVVWHKLSFFV